MRIGTTRVLSLAFVFAFASGPASKAQERWLRPGPVAPRVELVDQDNQRRRFDELVKDRPVLVSFFFTGCQTVCPTQTAQLSLLQARIDDLGLPLPARPLLISVSLDPYSDTPESIRDYAGRFGIGLGDERGWLMLTGNFEDLSQVWQSFDQDSSDPTDHSALFWVGQPANKRWTRADVTSDPSALLSLLGEETAR